MIHGRWPLLGAAALLGVLTISARAQNATREPKRPRLAAGADTNDAKAYYELGVSELDTHPQDAAMALYWAIRIDPAWADAYYARWVALHLSDENRYVYYVQRDKWTLRSPAVRQIDSLYLRALMLNPYLYRKFEHAMLYHFWARYFTKNVPGKIGAARLDSAVRLALQSGGYRDVSLSATVRAQNAYSLGDLPRAVDEFSIALAQSKEQGYVHAERGQIFYLLGAYDSAAAELSQAVKEWRPEDREHVGFVYESKALYEHSLAMIDEKQGHPDSAREAYGRALREDPSYAPAHMRLAAVDLTKGDTAGELGEMERAVQGQPNDGVIACLYGIALLQAGHAVQGLDQLKRAVTLEPYYAAPHALMAMAYDASEMQEEAAAEYSAFIRLANRTDPMLPRAQQRLSALNAPPGTPPPTPPRS